MQVFAVRVVNGEWLMIDALLCFSVGRGTWTTRHSERATTRKEGKDFRYFRLLNLGEVSGLALVYSSCSWFPSICSSELKRARSYFCFYR